MCCKRDPLFPHPHICIHLISIDGHHNNDHDHDNDGHDNDDPDDIDDNDDGHDYHAD